MKFCRDCLHRHKDDYNVLCRHPSLPRDLVSGKVERRSCHEERAGFRFPGADKPACGMAAHNFEPRLTMTQRLLRLWQRDSPTAALSDGVQREQDTLS